MDTTLREDLLPHRIFKTVTDITPEALAAVGAKALALDIDNTVAYDTTYTLFPGMREWVRGMQAAGVPMMILTNTYDARARSFAKRLGLPWFSAADKPSPAGFRHCAEAMGVDISELAMAGDQLFTDIRGANTAGAIPLLVLPRHREIFMFFYYRWLRKRERGYLEEHGFGDELKR